MVPSETGSVGLDTRGGGEELEVPFPRVTGVTTTVGQRRLVGPTGAPSTSVVVVKVVITGCGRAPGRPSGTVPTRRPEGARGWCATRDRLGTPLPSSVRGATVDICGHRVYRRTEVRDVPVFILLTGLITPRVPCTTRGCRSDPGKGRVWEGTSGDV